MACTSCVDGTFTADPATPCTGCTTCTGPAFEVLSDCTGAANRVCFAATAVATTTPVTAGEANVLQGLTVTIDIVVPDADPAPAVTVAIALPATSGGAVQVAHDGLDWDAGQARTVTFGSNIDTGLTTTTVVTIDSVSLEWQVVGLARTDTGDTGAVANRVRLVLGPLWALETVSPGTTLEFGVAASYGNVSAVAALVQVTTTAPLLVLAKTSSITGGAVDAGDTRAHAFSVTQAPTSTGPAYGLVITTIYGSGMTVDIATVACTGCVGGFTPTWNVPSGTLTVATPYLLVDGAQLDLSWTAVVAADVAPGAVLNLDPSVVLSYQSVAAAAYSGTAPVANRVLSAGATGTVPAPSLTLALASTSVAESTGTTVLIHEQLGLVVTMTLPEGVTSLSAEIRLPEVGGTVEVTGVSITSDASGSGGNLLDAATALAPVVATGHTTVGGVVTVSFDTVTNTADGNVNTAADTLSFTLGCTVADLPGTVDGTSLAFDARVVYGAGSTAYQSVTVTVAVPTVAMVVSATPTVGLEAGDTVAVTVAITAGASAAAFDIVVSETLAAGYGLVGSSALCSSGACGSSGWAVANTGGPGETVGLVVPVLLASETVQIVWSIAAGPAADVNASTNSATAFAGQYDTSPSDGAYPGRAVAIAEQSLAFVTKDPELTLTFGNNSFPETTAAELTPDEEIHVDLQLAIPRGAVTVRVEVEYSASFTPLEMQQSLPVDPASSGIAFDAFPAASLAAQTWTVQTTTVTKAVDSDAALVWDLGAELAFHEGTYEVPTVTARLYVDGVLALATDIQFTVVQPSMQIADTGAPYTGDAGDNITYSWTLGHVVASGIAAFDTSINYAVPAELVPVPGSLLICRLSSTLSAAPGDIIAAQCTGGAIGGTAIAASSADYAAGLFAANVPRISLDETVFFSIEATVTQDAIPQVDASAPISTTWRNGIDAVNVRYSAAAVQITSFTDPSFVTAAVVDSADDSTAANSVAIGEPFVVEIQIRIPEGGADYSVGLDSTPHITITNVGELAIGESMAAGNAPTIDLSSNPLTIALGHLENLADNVANSADIVAFNVSMYIVENNAAGPARGDTLAIAVTCTANSTLAASTSVPVIVALPLMTVDRLEIGAASPDVSGTDCSQYSSAADPRVESQEELTFRLQIRQRPQSLMNAYSVVVLCNLPGVTDLATNTFVGVSAVADSLVLGSGNAAAGLAAPEATLNGSDVFFRWASWPASTTGTLTFRLLVSAGIGMNTDLPVECGVEWSSVPTGNQFLGRVQDQGNGYNPWSAMTCTMTVVDPIWSAQFVRDGASTTDGQSGSPPYEVAIHAPLMIGVAVQFPEASGAISLTFSTDNGKTVLANEAMVTQMGSQLSGSTYALGDNVSITRNTHTHFGTITNVADGVLDDGDRFAVQEYGAVDDAAAVFPDNLYRFYITLRANTFTGAVMLFALVKEPVLALTAVISQSERVQAGDQITCTVTMTVTSTSPAYDLVLGATSSSNFGEITAAPNSDGFNQTDVTWLVNTVTDSVSAQRTYVIEVAENAVLGNGQIQCVTEVQFDGCPGTSQFGPGRMQSHVATSEAVLMAVPNISSSPAPYAPTSSSVDYTTGTSVAVGEVISSTFLVFLPKGVITDLAVQVTASDIPARVSVGIISAIIDPTVTCVDNTSSYTGLHVADIALGDCQRIGGSGQIGVQIVLSGTTVLDIPQNVDGATIGLVAALTYRNPDNTLVSTAVNVALAVVVPVLATSVTTPDTVVESNQLVTFVTAVDHTGSSSSAAFNVWVTAALADHLEFVEAASSTTAVHYPENNSWYLPVLELTGGTATFTLTARVTVTALLGGIIPSPDVQVDFTSVPNDALGSAATDSATVPQLTVSDAVSLVWNYTATSDTYTDDESLAIEENASLSGAITFAAASTLQLELLNTGMTAGKTDVTVADIEVAAHAVCANSPAVIDVVSVTDTIIIDFGFCTTTAPGETSIQWTITFTPTDVPQNVAGSVLQSNAVLAYGRDNTTTDRVSTPPVTFGVVEPTLAATATGLPFMFLAPSEATQLFFPAVIDPTFGHDVTVRIELTVELDFLAADAIVSTGSKAPVTTTVLGTSPSVVLLSFGSVATTDSIAFTIQTSVNASTSLMSVLSASLLVRAKSSSSAGIGRYTASSVTSSSSTEVWYFSAVSSVVNTTLGDTTNGNVSIGEGLTLQSHICFRGDTSLDLNITIPTNTDGDPIVALVGGIVVQNSGVNVQLSALGSQITDGASAVAATLSSAENSDTGAQINVLADCFDLAYYLEVTATGTAGDTGEIVASYSFATQDTATIVLDSVVAEPQATVSITLDNPAPNTQVTIATGVTLSVDVAAAASSYNSPMYDVVVSVDLLRLDSAELVVRSQDCAGASHEVSAGSLSYTIPVLQPSMLCRFSFYAPISSGLQPGDVSRHRATVAFTSLPATVSSSNAKSYSIFGDAASYLSPDLTPSISLEANSLSAFTSTVDHVPIGAVLDFEYRLVVPRVNINGLNALVTLPDSFAPAGAVDVFDASGEAIAVTMGVGVQFTTGLFLRNETDAIVTNFSAAVSDVAGNTRGTVQTIETYSTYPSSVASANKTVIIVEPVLILAEALNRLTGDAGDVFELEHIVLHDTSNGVYTSGCTAHDVSITITLTADLEFVSVSSPTVVVGSSPAASSCTAIDAVTALCELPTLDLSEQLTMMHEVRLKTTIEPSVAFGATSTLAYVSSTTAGGRSYSTVEQTPTATSSALRSEIVLFNRTGSGATSVSGQSTFGTIGEDLTVNFVVKLPEGHMDFVNLTITAPGRGLDQLVCELTVGTAITQAAVSTPDCGMDLGSYTASFVSLTDVDNAANNQQDSADFVTLALRFLVRDVADNVAGRSLALNLGVVTGTSTYSAAYTIAVREPQLSSAVQVQEIAAANTSVTFVDAGLDADRASRIMFVVASTHSQSGDDSPAYEVLSSIHVNGTISNYSIVVMNGAAVEASGVNTDGLIHSFNTSTMAISDSLIRTIQVQLDDSQNSPGDSICITADLEFRSLPDACGRAYATTAASCYTIRSPDQSNASDSSAFSPEGIVGMAVGVLLLGVIVAVVVLKKAKEKDTGRPLAEEMVPLKSPAAQKADMKLSEEKKAQIKQDFKAKKAKEKAKKAEQKKEEDQDAADNLKQAVAFARLRYGKDAPLDENKLAMVFDLLELSPRPNKQMVGAMIEETQAFLQEPIAEDTVDDDAFIDEVVDFVFAAIPDLMLESCIDAFAKMQEELEKYFAEAMAAKRAAKEAAEAEGIYEDPVGEAYIDVYEIPAKLLGGLSEDDEEDGYAEIGDDFRDSEGDYMVPSVFRDIAEDERDYEESDYAELLELLEEATYAEAVALLPEDDIYAAAEEEQTYNTHFGEIYDNRGGVGGFPGIGSALDATYDDDMTVESLYASRPDGKRKDSIYGIDDDDDNNDNDPYTNIRPDDEDVYETANHGSTLTRKPTIDIRTALSMDEEAVYGLQSKTDGSSPAATLRRESDNTLRRPSDSEDMYENSTTLQRPNGSTRLDGQLKNLRASMRFGAGGTPDDYANGAGPDGGVAISNDPSIDENDDDADFYRLHDGHDAALGDAEGEEEVTYGFDSGRVSEEDGEEGNYGLDGEEGSYGLDGSPVPADVDGNLSAASDIGSSDQDPSALAQASLSPTLPRKLADTPVEPDEIEVDKNDLADLRRHLPDMAGHGTDPYNAAEFPTLERNPNDKPFIRRVTDPYNVANFSTPETLERDLDDGGTSSVEPGYSEMLVPGDGAGEVIYMAKVPQRTMSERLKRPDAQADLNWPSHGGSMRSTTSGSSATYAVVKPKKAKKTQSPVLKPKKPKKTQSLTDVDESGNASVGFVNTTFKSDEFEVGIVTGMVDEVVVNGLVDFAEPVEPAAPEPDKALGGLTSSRSSSYGDAVSDAMLQALAEESEEDPW